jgi:hypothetical protein
LLLVVWLRIPSLDCVINFLLGLGKSPDVVSDDVRLLDQCRERFQITRACIQLQQVEPDPFECAYTRGKLSGCCTAAPFENFCVARTGRCKRCNDVYLRSSFRSASFQ